ncbi:MAG: hypothetical protein DRI65_17880, partial [Chloroflexota bacterium]
YYYYYYYNYFESKIASLMIRNAITTATQPANITPTIGIAIKIAPIMISTPITCIASKKLSMTNQNHQIHYLLTHQLLQE